jgi:hypothetical protein
MTTVVNLRHLQEGWELEEDTTYIGRGSPRRGLDGAFGNPFSAGSRQENIEAFDRWLRKRCAHDPEYRAKILALAGRRLACFCKPLPCHGDAIVQYIADSDEMDEQYQ